MDSKMMVISDEIDEMLGKLHTGINYEWLVTTFGKDVAAMYYCGQNNPHHIGSVFHHTVKAIQHVNDQYLKIVMLLHDIGKPFCKAINAKTGFDIFYNHEEIGSIIAGSVMVKWGFNLRDIRKIQKLIRAHDLSMHMVLDSAKENGFNILVTRENVVRRMHEYNLDIDEIYMVLDICHADVMAQSEFQRESKLAVITGIRKVADELRKELK